MYLLAIEETIDLHTFPYSTLALVSGRLPTLALNLVMPYMVSVMPGNKYEKLFEQSYVCSKLRHFYVWIENTFHT